MARGRHLNRIRRRLVLPSVVLHEAEQVSNTRRRGGRRWRRLVAYVLVRDGGVCWLCGHDGADTGDHVLPIDTHPHLEFDPSNVRAAHGRTRTVTGWGYYCKGNYARGADAAPTTSTHSRQW